MRLKVLSAGAAQSVVTVLAQQFRSEAGYEVDTTFATVGALIGKLSSGASADIVVLTAALIDELAINGHVYTDSCADLGRVRTGVAVPARDPRPAIADAAALRATLLRASGLYFPDPQRATAGIHAVRDFTVPRQCAVRLRGTFR